MTTVRRGFIGAAVGWAVSLPLAARLASQPHAAGSAFGYGFALIVYAAGSLVCHQRPERSFHLFTVQMPVCARCVGLYVGAAVAAAIATLWARGDPARTPSDVSSIGWRVTRDLALARVVVLVSAVPTMATLLYEWTTGQMPANWVRALAGVPLGGVVAWVACLADWAPREIN
jgi:hypothetical protein